MSQQGKKPSGPAELGPDPLAGYGFAARIAPNVIGFISSAAIMVLELVAGRLVSNNVGSSQYTWTSIIGVILAGMAVGNWYGGKLADDYRPIRILWILFSGAAVLILITIPLNWAISGLKQPLITLVVSNPGGSSHLWGLSVLLMMTLVFIWPAAALGVISPVVAKLAIDLNPSSGRAVGTYYSWGAVGAIVGTFLTGFVVVSHMSVQMIIVSVALVMGLLAFLSWLPLYLASVPALPAKEGGK